jgi:hypothetical protein
VAANRAAQFDFAAGDRQVAGNARLGPDLDLPAGHACAARDRRVDAQLSARRIQRFAERRGDAHVAAGGERVASDGCLDVDARACGEQIAGHRLRDAHRRPRRETVIAEAAFGGGFALAVLRKGREREQCGSGGDREALWHVLSPDVNGVER